MSNETTPPTKRPSTPVDWASIHSRLEQTTRLLEQKSTLAEKNAVLRDRARLLAQEPKAQTEGEQLEIVEFLLAYERYAIESEWVREIYPLKEITTLPGTPPFILGIINVRGQIISVVDMKAFFGLPGKGLTNFNKVIILSHDDMEFGLLTDEVLGVRFLPRSEIQAPLPTLTGVRADYLKGVTLDRLVVLDAVRLLTDPKMKISQSMD